MSCTQLLALANDTAGTSSSVGGSSLISQYSMDSWVNSWKMESNPLNLNHGSSLGINNTGIAGDTTTEKPQREYNFCLIYLFSIRIFKLSCCII